MADKRPALGRGLGALIPSAAPSVPRERETARPSEIDIDLLTPNPRQPRVQMDDTRLDELAQSIRSHGVIQPILVRRAGDRTEIVAGERRWRAAQRAGLLKVPVVYRDIADENLLEIALIENIQREDLNPIEEAQAYRRLTEEFHLSQEAIAAGVGKDRATIANYMRLLKLPAEVRNDLASGALSMGQARALITLPDEAAQRRVAREVVARGLSVRETEAMVRHELAPAPPPPPPRRADPNTRAAEDRLKVALGTTRVRIVRKGQGGRIEIEFAGEDELQRLYETIVRKSE
jgi:ParB family transcriptional regulator, chromosome partitioning protein